MSERLEFPFLHYPKKLKVGQIPQPVAHIPEGDAEFYRRNPQPLVPVTFFRPDGDVAFTDWALVDTGADISSLPSSSITRFGLVPENCEPDGEGILGPAGLEPSLKWKHGFAAELRGHRFHISGIFTEGPWPWPVLGQRDFFNAFRLMLHDKRAGKFVLKPYGGA